MSTFIIKDLGQAKLLTDPFKLQLLERFAGRPITTKQVADQMGEKAPRLYRHVDALHEAGLLELVEEKPKRGTVERYYTTVASRFEVDPELFSPSAGEEGAIDVVRSMLRDTESEILRAISDMDVAEDPGDDNPPLVMRATIRATPAEAQRLKEKLDAWLSECQSLCDGADDDPAREAYSALLAFYPVADD